MAILWIFLLLLVLFVLISLRIRAIKNRRYFEKQGIMYLGNRNYALIYQALKGTTVEQSIQAWYDLMIKNGKRIAGSKEFGANVFTIIDPELIKHITVSDFDHFVNRREFDMPEEEILFGKMLFSLRGQTWKNFRAIISPAFTSGKIKRLYRLFQKSGDSMIHFLHEKILESAPQTNSALEVEMVNVIEKYTLEVIGTAVCGIETRAFDPKEESVMGKMARRMQLTLGPVQVLKILTVMTFPIVANLLKMSFFDKEAEAYFMWAIKQTIQTRLDNPDKNWDDFVQLMVEGRRGVLKKEGEEISNGHNNYGNAQENGKGPEKNGNGNSDQLSLKDLSDEHIIANCVLFVMAGFDTTQGSLIFALYSLALNPELQDRLRTEIEQAVEEDAKNVNNGGFLSYDKLHELKYLDMVLNETMRLYPPSILFDRGCTKEYKLPGTDFVLKKGQGVFVPILGIHRDEQFFPNATQFDPERFSEENKHKIKPGTFIPFGSGLRQCIGMRFAITEGKLGIAMLIYHYKFEPTKNTPIPMAYMNGNILKPKNGLKLNITKIPRSRPSPNP